ncbi:MAG: hypothetical protein FGM54_06835 [Chitinophagaceae bacterium]|nr:hypothetical protein [Chitinophagaceae bacterium]
MNRLKLYVLALFVAISFSACKKKPMAGLGGNAVIIARCQHHGSSIDSGIVYIKYNSLEAVAMGEYNQAISLSKDSNNLYTAQFKGLKPGEYYLFAEGWDPSISNNVKGGVPFTIEKEEQFNIIIPVTEVH